MPDIESIQNPEFIKDLSIQECEKLASEIRSFLVQEVSETGGHLSSNLGVVELTIALLYCFNPPYDSILFDVSHQSYIYKILTGRANQFSTLRQKNGLSGFSNPKESIYDSYVGGHSSTTISAMSGFLLGQTQEEEKSQYVVGVVGDSAMSNGVSFEGLNFLGTLKNKNAIIILNDNQMGINRTKGALSRMLSNIRLNKGYLKTKRFLSKITPRFIRKFFKKMNQGIKGMLQTNHFFEDLGFRYYGPVDGHNIKSLISYFERAKNLHQPLVIHVVTQKGKGLEEAMNDEIGKYHCIEGNKEPVKEGEKLSKIYEDELIPYFKKDSSCYLISSAMVSGSHLNTLFEEYPTQCVDVGIMESHAAIMATSLSLKGKKVFLSYYSSFFQRAYDQLIEDISFSEGSIVLLLDHCGLVSHDGKTHQGIYDLSMLSSISNIEILHPTTSEDIKASIQYAYSTNKNICIRYEKDSMLSTQNEFRIRITEPIWRILYTPNKPKGILISYGSILRSLMKDKDQLEDCYLIDALFLKPVDDVLLKRLLEMNLKIVIAEEVIFSGSLSETILEYCYKHHLDTKKILSIHLPNSVDCLGTREEMLEEYHLDPSSIKKQFLSFIEKR